MKKNIDKRLLIWKDSADRKVLLVKGARQVGKTYSIRAFGKQFKYFLEVNFEEHRDITGFEVFNSVALQAGCKFKYSNIDSQAAHIPLKEALEILAQAGLVYKVYHSSAQGIPLGGQIKANKFKVILFDSGIHLQMLGLGLQEILSSQNIDLINKGNLAEVFVGNELIKYLSQAQKKDIYYWHRESRASNAEVDYVIQKGMDIIPIEVKSGVRGKMQSLRLFLMERKVKKGVRLSLDEFSIYADIWNYPLYAISNLVDVDTGNEFLES